MVIQRHKSVIFGLENDLTVLTNKDTALDNKITTADQRAISEEQRIESKLDTAVIRIDGDVDTNNKASQSRDTGLSNRLDIVEGNDTVEGSIAKAEKDAKDFAQQLVDATNGDLDTLQALVDVINGASTVEGSFRKAISDVVGVAPEVLDTLGEIANSLNNDPDLYNTIVALISSNITNAKNELKGAVSEAFDTLEEVENALDIINGADSVEGSILKAVKDTKAYADSITLTEKNRAEGIESTKLNIANNLSDVADPTAARANIDVYSKFETNEAVRLGGAIFTQESLTVASDKITLNHEAKNNIVFNFSCVRYVDSDMVSWDVPVTHISGAEYQLHPNFTGQFDGKSVTVQYAYVPQAV